MVHRMTNTMPYHGILLTLYRYRKRFNTTSHRLCIINRYGHVCMYMFSAGEVAKIWGTAMMIRLSITVDMV